jgi:hypothetical protein
LIRAGVPQRIAMMFTGHKTRAVFDRHHIVYEQELLGACDRLAEYLTVVPPRAGQARAGRRAASTGMNARDQLIAIGDVDG